MYNTTQHEATAPKEESLLGLIQEMYLLYNFDEYCLFTAGDKKAD